MAKCLANTKKGSRCKNAALAGGYCEKHNPLNRELTREAQRLEKYRKAKRWLEENPVPLEVRELIKANVENVILDGPSLCHECGQWKISEEEITWENLTM